MVFPPGEKATEETLFLGIIHYWCQAKKISVEARKIRNQAFTHLKEAVDYIREYGRYVFWRNPARLKGYRSDYRRMLKQRSTRRNNVPELEPGYVPITNDS